MALLIASTVLAAAPAAAHAEFLTSDPAPGARLSTPPRVVVMEFSEPLIEELSSASVRDPQGTVVRGGSVGERRMRVALATSVPGVYEVRWKTVSPLDGHTREGWFRFGVGTDPGPEAGGTATTDAPASRDLLLALARAAEYGALLLAVGYSVLALLADRSAVFMWNAHRRRALVVAFVAGFAVVGGEAALAAGFSANGIADFLATGQGRWRLARLALEAAAVCAAYLRRSMAVAVALGAALVAIAGTGHAAAVRPRWWAVASDALHLAAAGAWAGTIGAFVVSRGWRRLDRSARHELLGRFTRVAVVAFVATVVFGVVRASQELGALGDFLDTGYGGALAVKILLVVAMVPLSLVAWRRRRVAHTEGLLVGGVVMLAALLAAFPASPGRSESEAAHSADDDLFRPAAHDLTIGGRAGDALVALTLRPGRPGANDVFLTIVPAQGAPPPRPSQVRFLVDESPLPLSDCGRACLSASAIVDGGDRIDMELDDGTDTTFALPDLPARDARALLESLTARMNDLRSYRLDEVFGPLDPALRSTWEIVAPDRLHITFSDRSELIRVADRSYRRDGPDQPWAESETPMVRMPSHIWDVSERRAARILGTETVDGQATTIVSFYGESDGSRTPLWYRLWVDDRHLVRRAEMRAPGHFMDHTYRDFDAPITVQPPDAQ